MNLLRRKRIYLDHAAGTPLDPQVHRAMCAYMKAHFGNPGGIHQEAVHAKNALERARAQVADFFSCTPNEIIFTSGGTESNNLAIQGFFNALDSFGTLGSKWHAITTKIEHPAVLDVFRMLEKKGLAVSYLDVDEHGAVRAEDVKAALQENTAMVSVMYVNNETGVVQPIKEIAKLIRAHKKSLGSGNPHDRSGEFSSPVSLPVFHVDGAQLLNHLETDVRKSHVDLLSASASKIYGPKGVGVLYVRHGTPLAHVLIGGKQERGLRAGTENVPGLVGLGEAITITKKIKEKETARVQELRSYFLRRIKGEFPHAIINGAGACVPNIINISFPGASSEELVLRLDAKGVAVAARSACESDKDASYVVRALGEAHHPESAVRFSMGRSTTKKDLDYVIKSLKEVLKIVQASS